MWNCGRKSCEAEEGECWRSGGLSKHLCEQVRVHEALGGDEQLRDGSLETTVAIELEEFELVVLNE